MRLDWIALSSFRSYPNLEFTPESGVNVLVGPNGAGKTNVLEAIGYLASLRSFRGAPDEALVAFDAESGVVRGQVSDGDATSLIEVEFRRRGSRRAQVNRQRLQRTADLLGFVRVVAFLPEDLDIVKRGPSYRRDFLDELAVQLWPGSHLDQAEFDRALRQRNSFLKQRDADQITLSVWDERLSQAGGKVMARRARAVSVLMPELITSHGDVAGEERVPAVDYNSEWKGELDPGVGPGEFAARLLAELTARHKMDRDRGVTTVGPHRDEPVLRLDGHDLRYHGSQGEQRTMALSLRVASHRAITRFTDAPPILLLDDVYSELDPDRAESLTAHLPAAQTFVSTAHPGDIPLTGTVWQVGGGQVRVGEGTLRLGDGKVERGEGT